MEELLVGPLGLAVVVVSIVVFIRTSKVFKATGKTVIDVVNTKQKHWVEDVRISRLDELASQFDDLVETHGSLEIASEKANQLITAIK